MLPSNKYLIEIERKSQFKFSYVSSDINSEKRISLNMPNESLYNILKKLGREYDLAFERINNTIAVWKATISEKEQMGKRGNIKGKVTDAATGKPLYGTNVYIQGTSIGAATNIDGYYEIPLVPLGSYELTFRFIGFQQKIIDINLSDLEKIIQVNAQLNQEVLKGEPVIVSDQAFGQKQAINQQISANAIKNVVSSAEIEEIPDATAAESIGRLPGVSIIREGGEANKISIRGLAPKFNDVQLNGVSFKSNDQYDRSIDIAMISANLLSGIEVIKTKTADMEANSLGGFVNLTVRKAPEKSFLDLTAQGGYHGHSGKLSNYKFVATGGHRFFNSKLGIFANGFFENKNTDVDVFDPGFGEDLSLSEEMRSTTARLIQITFRSVDEVRERFGGSLVIDYKLPFGHLQFFELRKFDGQEYTA